MAEEIKKENNLTIKKFIKIFLLIIVGICIIFYSFIRFVEPKMLKINEYAVIDTSLPKEFNGFKIVHFSDIHYGSSINDEALKKIVNKINELKPDVIVYTGDLLNDSINLNEDNFNTIKDILVELKSTIKKYAVIGDSDYVNKDNYLKIMSEAGFTILENENDLVFYKGNTPLQFIGTSSMLENEFNINEAIKTETNDMEYFKIWLNHEPAVIDKIIDKDLRPNLLLTGHTLGGLMKFPMNSYLLKQDGISKYTDNYYRKKKINMYISNGLGTYKYNVRFMNSPSINLYRLYNE